ncbi:arf-GAP with GTPase, ANK repeat and PH domain-containing protein 3-like isoform X7 [Lineus longissimus]|uniref:arf-GAP with GTPase, ANK repeat and PH domain-containing protein 3-like isoform X7 n=1 Tax=Lineus longissimus TaxID=88925 RepID=UPI00315C6DF2
MTARGYIHPQSNISLAIRQEIQRFESVHPSIYAIYDLIEAIPDQNLQDQIRDHVVCIEDSFVNSQEWTLSRSVPDIKLGILGSIHSGKSALVHRYLTGSYMQEESPEGGRFKKEVMIDGQSYLLLIRDEGGPPELQFTHWVDAVIFVFSLENEMSFHTVYNYFSKMAHYRNTTEIPLILVGTQDAISESNPRVIDDMRARKLASDLKRCSYYETCATYGLNVERVFQDACQKIVQSRINQSLTPNNSRPSTPNHSIPRGYLTQTATNKSYDSSSGQSTSGSGNLPTATPSNSSHNIQVSQSRTLLNSSSFGFQSQTLPYKEHYRDKKHKERKEKVEGVPGQIQQEHYVYTVPQGDQRDAQQQQMIVWSPAYAITEPTYGRQVSQELRNPSLTPLPPRRNKKPQHLQKSNSFNGASEMRELPSPVGTPLLSRKKNSSVRGHSDRSYSASSSTESASNTPQSQRSYKDKQPSEGKDLPTPSSTPTQSRKNRRRSNLFTFPRPGLDAQVSVDGKTHQDKQKKGEEEKVKEKGATVQKNGSDSLGSGRSIPIKQGYLYKRSTKLVNKEWKKKYVTLLDNGKLTYHPNLHDYMDDQKGKEISLIRTTVKIPGMLKPRCATKMGMSTNGLLKTQLNDLSSREGRKNGREDSLVISNTSVTPANLHVELQRRFEQIHLYSDETGDLEMALLQVGQNSAGVVNSKIETPNVKKRHRRAKSSGPKNDASQVGDDDDDYEFIIVSLDNKSWHFEASSHEEREEWVSAVEQQILCSLQACESGKSKSRSNTLTDPSAVQAIRSVRGNQNCCDCDAPNPDWASLNLGALICIECSGIHRNLGTHLSRVRSLDLDEWPPELVAVMTCIGNTLANSVWEAAPKNRMKPSPSSPREEKEIYIRAKYDKKEWLPPLPYRDIPAGQVRTEPGVAQQLIDSIVRDDIRNVIILLAYASPEHVNSPYSKQDARTALHIAAALGNFVYVQLLLWYNADVKVVDHDGRNALYYARTSEVPECIELLKNSGCPECPTLPRRRNSQQQQQMMYPQPLQQNQLPPPPPPPQAPQPIYVPQPKVPMPPVVPTLPSQQGQGQGDVFDKLPASVI